MMDTQAKDDSAPLSTVTDYALAIQRVGGGHFTGRFSESGQRAFASFYGAPFFALARLAPEAISHPGSSLLFITSDPSTAADGGRWLSLYSKAQRSAHRLNLSVCIPAKPPSGKAPKPLLFQPPQQVLVKDWRKHLAALDVPPDVLIFQPLDLDDLASAADTFCRHAAGRKALVSCATLLDSLIARQLLNARGFAIGEATGFSLAPDEPQHHAPGAWWFSAVAPAGGAFKAANPDLIEPLRCAQRVFHDHLNLVKGGKDRELVAAVYATRSTETVEDADAIRTVRSSPEAGICLSTGRFFSRPASDEEDGFCWEEKVLSADLLSAAPADDVAHTQDEDRLAMMLWLARAMTEEAHLDAPVLPTSENDLSASLSADEPSQLARMEAPASAPPAGEAASAAPAAPVVAATSVDATPAPIRSRLSRSAGTVNVLAMAAMLGKARPTAAPAFEKAKKLILDWLANKDFRSLDAASNHHVEYADGEVTIETDGQGIWAMRFDDRRSMEDGAIWRVEITLLGGGTSAISVRMAQVRSSEEAPPPVASGVPAVVAKIAQQIGLQDAGVALVDAAQHLKGSKDALWFGQLLLNPDRSHPVITISGNVDQSADRLAKRLAGVAHVLRIDNALSDSLLRRFGRDRAVYGNAVRLYRPGFTADSDSYQHPIWALKGTVLPKWLADDIFEQACAISLEVGDLEERAPSFQTIRNHLAKSRHAASEQRLTELRRRAESIASSAEERISQLEAINQELEAALSEQKTQNKQLLELAAQADGELQATRRERNAALEEVRQLKFQINSQWNEVETGYTESEDQVEYPDTWDDLETWVELYAQDRLVLHPKAAKAARESPFKDIPLAYKAMDYLVRYYVPMRTRSADDHEAYQRSKHALAELGLEESDVGTADEIKRYKQEYKRQYDGSEVTLDRHLKRGVGFGGEFQFRLYFYYDDKAEKVLVGHMPTHLTNRLTHNG